MNTDFKKLDQEKCGREPDLVELSPSKLLNLKQEFLSWEHKESDKSSN
jgi:hypothetical protein